ncbi:MAG TPA: rRNA maturation RNase YbeY [bacterium]|nr:rRNA maturation RNase YbeY [bacterium]
MRLFATLKVKSSVNQSWLRRLSSHALRKVKGPSFEKRSELSIVLTGDSEVRRLNRLYRRKDKTTDVLSFPLLEGKILKLGGRETIPLGDVVISVPQTRRQATQQGKKFRQELALLLVHGILHLLGYDHVTVAGEKRMFNLQERLLKTFDA